VMDTIIAKI